MESNAIQCKAKRSKALKSKAKHSKPKFRHDFFGCASGPHQAFKFSVHDYIQA